MSDEDRVARARAYETVKRLRELAEKARADLERRKQQRESA